MNESEIDWNSIISNPDGKVEIDRKTLWAMWNVLTSTDFSQRDKYWEHASKKIKRLLNLI